jgi:hypothetical protein
MGQFWYMTALKLNKLKDYHCYCIFKKLINCRKSLFCIGAQVFDRVAESHHAPKPVNDAATGSGSIPFLTANKVTH